MAKRDEEDGEGSGGWWTLAQWREAVEKTLDEAERCAQALARDFGPARTVCAVQSIVFASAVEACAVVRGMEARVVEAAFGDAIADPTLSAHARGQRAAWRDALSGRHSVRSSMEDDGLARRVRRGVADAVRVLSRDADCSRWLEAEKDWEVDEWERVECAWRECMERWQGDRGEDVDVAQLRALSSGVRVVVRWAAVEASRGVEMGVHVALRPEEGAGSLAEMFGAASVSAADWSAGDGVGCRRLGPMSRIADEKGEHVVTPLGDDEFAPDVDVLQAPLFPFVLLAGRVALPTPIAIWPLAPSHSNLEG
jgi:hypothetical protein